MKLKYRKVLKRVKQRWQYVGWRWIVVACLVILGAAWLLSSTAMAGSGPTMRELKCMQALEDHTIIRNFRAQGYSREAVKSFVREDIPEADRRALWSLIDEAYNAVNVDAWFGDHMARCMMGLQDAALVNTASSEALVSPALARDHQCRARAEQAGRAIYAARRGLDMPPLPWSWSDAERHLAIAVQESAKVWPRGEAEFARRVLSECLEFKSY